MLQTSNSTSNSSANRYKLEFYNDMEINGDIVEINENTISLINIFSILILILFEIGDLSDLIKIKEFGFTGSWKLTGDSVVPSSYLSITE